MTLERKVTYHNQGIFFDDRDNSIFAFEEHI